MKKGLNKQASRKSVEGSDEPSWKIKDTLK